MMSVGKAFRFCNPNAFHVLFLCFFCVGEIWSFCFLIPGWSHCATHMASFMLNYIPWNYKLKEALFSSKLLLITVFYYNNIKITNIPDSLKQWDVANIMEMSNNIFWNQTCFKNINDTHHGFTLIKVEAVLFIGLLNCEKVILVVVKTKTMTDNVITDSQEFKIINVLYMDITGFTWEINILGLMLTTVT